MNFIFDKFNFLFFILENIDKKEKLRLKLLICLIIVASLSEVISLSLVFPFLAAMQAPEKVFTLLYVKKIVLFLQEYSSNFSLIEKLSYNSSYIQFFLAILFSSSAVLAGILRIGVLYFSNIFASDIGTNLNKALFQKFLSQKFSDAVSLNSSLKIGILTAKINFLVASLFSLIQLISSTCVVVCLIIVLLTVSPFATLLSIFFLFLFYAKISFFAGKKLKNLSTITSSQNTTIFKYLQESFESIREIMLEGNQKYYVDLFGKADSDQRCAFAKIAFISQCPRYIIEPVGMILFAGLAFFFALKPEGFALALPLLGGFALGVTRILPAMQQGYIGWGTIKAYQTSTEEFIKTFNQIKRHEKSSSPVKFRSSFGFRSVFFRYSNRSDWVIKNLSFEIPKGKWVGIRGRTGAGKTTCLDLLVGLLAPIKGNVFIDTKKLTKNNRQAWRKKISYVPQTIFLSDSSVAENIAFGIPQKQIDMKMVIEAANFSHASKFIEKCPEGFQALCGERGVSFSGGQKQRIGIARALYKKPEILILDEATNALDPATENSILLDLKKHLQDKTVIIISHRTSTLRFCDLLVDLNQESKKN